MMLKCPRRPLEPLIDFFRCEGAKILQGLPSRGIDGGDSHFGLLVTGALSCPKTPNTKHQTPGKFESPITNNRASNQFGAWNLEFPWLVGVWDLVLTNAGLWESEPGPGDQTST